MGFRNGAYAKVWRITDLKDGAVVNIRGKDYQMRPANYASGRITVSKKDKKTGEYRTEFSNDFVKFVGSAREKAMLLGEIPEKKGVTIVIKDCDVQTYMKQPKDGTGKDGYVATSFTIFDFDVPDDSGSANSTLKASAKTAKAEVVTDDDLPF